ncbi:hypothetical protein ACHIPZ_21675 [Antrihabitans sp. NCIMB 15449]|uniref:Uncharacterized protein n=1 Tax=Antrihabitans spumae TaxID=3373370 RepID=A0ABW7JV13_9NOCA
MDERQKTARDAQLYTLAVVSLALIVLIVSAALAAASGNECAEDTVLACHSTARAMIAYVPSTLLLVGAVGAFVRTYQVWRRNDEWRIWHGAGWVLFVVLAIYLGMAATVLTDAL